MGDMLQAPVVQRLDNAIHRISRYPADKCYPVDSVIQLLNNLAQLVNVRGLIA